MPLEPTDTCEKDLWAQGGPNLRIHCATRPMGFMKATVVLRRMGSLNPYAPANSGHYWAYLLAADDLSVVPALDSSPHPFKKKNWA